MVRVALLSAIALGCVGVPVALDLWAWHARRPSVGWWRFGTHWRLTRADLYTREGNRRRRLAVRAYLLGAALGAAAVVLLAAVERLRR